MNPRERVLVVFLVLVILGAGGWLFGYRFFWVPYTEKQATLKRMRDDYMEKQTRKAEIERDRKRLEVWQQMSLPGDTDVARREYGRYLTELLSRNGVAAGKFDIKAPPVDAKSSPTIPGTKEPIYTKLVFNIQCYAPMKTLTKALEEFYRTGLMHQVKSLTIQRQLTATGQGRNDELDVRMVVEALIVSGADKRTWLLPAIDRRLLALDLINGLRRAPSGLALAAWAAGPTGPLEIDRGPLRARQEGHVRPLTSTKPDSTPIEVVSTDASRDYAVLGQKNIFLGRPPREVREEAPIGPPELMVPRHVRINDITTNDRGRTETFLFDLFTDRRYRLRATPGFNTFPLARDANGKTVVVGAVAKIDERDLIFRVQINAEESAARSSGGPGFFPLDAKERSALVAEKVIAAGEEDRVFWVEESYWESVVKQRIFRVRESDPDSFRIMLERDSDRPPEDPEASNPVELTRGKVVRRKEGEVLIKLEDRFYGMHIGQPLEDALKTALPESQVKELKLADGR